MPVRPGGRGDAATRPRPLGAAVQAVHGDVHHAVAAVVALAANVDVPPAADSPAVEGGLRRLQRRRDPLLMVHGYPQTHFMWHKVAPAVAEHFTVIAPDLRGYGDSGHPPDGDNHSGYSKRAMARDLVEVMAALGFEHFNLVGHDRGGRVAHRLTLDHRDRVEKVCVLDIAPTRWVFADTDQALATAYHHWFFLIQRAPYPETMIGHDVEFYLRSMMMRWGDRR